MNTPITDAAGKAYAYGGSLNQLMQTAGRLELDRAALMEALEECRKLLEFMPLEYVHKDRLDPIVYSSDGALAMAQSALSTARANFPQP